MTDRRRFLQWAAAGAAGAGWLAVAPHLALARAATERRFVFVIQRGAADGLETLLPYADPGYARLRGAIAVEAGDNRLDGSFALHPAMNATAAMYRRNEVLLLHAVASPYGDRSHFDGQNVLESGGVAPGQLRDGWLNRLTGLLPEGGREAIALAPTVPLALRGARGVTSYSAGGAAGVGDDLLARVGALYHDDPQLHALWQAALDAREVAQEGSAAAGMGSAARTRGNGAGLGRLAANFLAQPNGPRVAMIETNGWDTHSAQNARLAARLRELDAMLDALREGLGTAWADTVVLVATEFGRTAAANGTGGTDHGSGAVAMLLGGAVQGGRVLADWPGLAQADLLEGRDLRPTLSLDRVIAAAAGECYGIEPARVRRLLFPRGDALARGGAGMALPRLLRA